MADTRDVFSRIVPNLFELDKTTIPYTLYLDAIGGDTVTVSSDPWDNIRTSQSVQLYVGDLVVAIQRVPPRDAGSPADQLGKPPVFNVPVKKYFQAGMSSSIHMVMFEGAPPGPNNETSKTLSFVVKANSLIDALKIDITEGAAGYNEKFPSLLPANVAVIRGPAGKALVARSAGAVRFQDVGGATTCNFSFDSNGVCPLVLIRIDSLHETGKAGANQDMISLTLHGETDALITKPVTFGEYETITGAAAQAFKSISCNTVGIADGSTICIVSIIMADPASKARLTVSLDPGLTLVKQTFSSAISTTGNAALDTVTAANGAAEFGITATTPGTYKVAVFPETMPDAYWRTSIEYRALS